MMYVSFPGRVQALHYCRCYCLLENYSYTQDSVMFKRSCHSLETVQKTISDQNRLCYGNQSVQGQTLVHVRMYPLSPVSSHGQLYLALSRSSSLHNAPVAITEGRRQHIESEQFYHCISRRALKFPTYK